MSASTQPHPPVEAPPAALRYPVAAVILFYGFAKLMGSQFTILDSELDRPMREVSGFWLTWYYFGYSAVYGNLIALVQVGGALLLTFRRTTLLGACILFGMMSNIVLVDVFYGIPQGAFFVALLLWCGLLGILLWYREPLLALFWPSPERVGGSSRRRSVAWTLRVCMIAFAAGGTYWTANYNNRRPTPLDGRWDVAGAQGFPGKAVPSRIYFEHNRAHMAVFRYADSTATHHFEVDPAQRTIRVWDRWFRKTDDTQLFAGTYRLDAGRLELTGRMAGSPVPVTLRLVRVP